MDKIEKHIIESKDKSEKKIKKGTTRQHFDKLFGFAKEKPTKSAVASSSLSMDHTEGGPSSHEMGQPYNSTDHEKNFHDKITAFNKKQIQDLIGKFPSMQRELKNLKDNLEEMSKDSLGGSGHLKADRVKWRPSKK